MEDLAYSTGRFEALLDRLWVLDNDHFGFLAGRDASLRGQIRRHVFRNPGD